MVINKLVGLVEDPPSADKSAPTDGRNAPGAQESRKKLNLRIYQPKQVRPDAAQNQELEQLVRDVVMHSDEEDLYQRFFGYPNV